jgi:cytochrome o ubiquinol oxidase subunit 2
MAKMCSRFLIFIALFAIAYFGLAYLQEVPVPVLEPKGSIAFHEKELIIHATLLMLIVGIPVFLITFFVLRNYKESNKKATYAPMWDNNVLVELVWWGLPFVIVVILSYLVWTSSHALDPFKPLASDKKPITIQVVALQWKWLFLYPEYGIASVNYLQFPEKTPVNFEVTADAPMNSFWIPQLGGQIYAMPGMRTKLHLIAEEEGLFRGSSANLSGTGFSKMKFHAEAVSDTAFAQWVQMVKESKIELTKALYKEIADPNTEVAKETFCLTEEGLFDGVVMKYMRH